MLKSNLTGYAFILPNIIGVVLFTLIPMLYSLFVSFTDWDYTKGFGNYNFIGIKNFIDMWSDEWFTTSLLNTIFFSVVVVPATIILALVIAVIIDRYCFAKLPIRLMMFMPYISNVVAVAIVWVMMYSPWGPFTQLMEAFGWKEPPQWLGDPTWALPAIMLMTIWSNVGYAIMIYTSSIQGLPKDAYEAAEIDGCNHIQQVRYVTLPGLKNTFTYVMTMTILSCFNVMGQPMMLTPGEESTEVAIQFIYDTAFGGWKLGRASVMSIIMALIMFVFSLIALKKSIGSDRKNDAKNQ